MLTSNYFRVRKIGNSGDLIINLYRLVNSLVIK